MSLKRGNEIVVREKVDLKETRLSLKKDQSVNVVLIGVNDYVEVPSHSDFANKIYPQSCFSVIDKECPLCQAYKAGHVSMKPVTRFKFAMYVVDEAKIMFFDATFTQGKKLIKQIKDFTEDIEYGTMFKFERTGTGTDTAYILTPIAERKLTDKDKGIIESVKEMEVEDAMFEAICMPVSENYAKELMYNAFKFGDAPIKEEQNENQNENQAIQENETIKNLPF